MGKTKRHLLHILRTLGTGLFASALLVGVMLCSGEPLPRGKHRSTYVRREYSVVEVGKAFFCMGECVEYEGEEISSYLKRIGAEERHRELLEDTTIVYAYRAGLAPAWTVGGKTVNVQIVQRGARLLVGIPAVYGAF